MIKAIIILIFVSLANDDKHSFVSLFPNLTHGTIHIDVDFQNQNDTNPWKVKIFNMSVTTYFQQVYNDNLPSEYDVSNLTLGEYIFLVVKGDVQQALQFIKE